MPKSKRKKIFLLPASLIALLLFIYFLGPKPPVPNFSSIAIPHYSADLHRLEDSIIKAEALLPLKPDNEARIVWDTPYVKTPFSMVYIHGNAASQEEGDPIHEALAHRYGCNLFLARLYDHGLQIENPMLDITAEKWMQSALDAIAIGHLLGEKVILVSTSTGSTLALYLAAKYPELVDGLILMSPNIDMYDPRSSLLANPWGLQIARKIMKSQYYGWKPPGAAQQYWYPQYRIEGLCTLKSMINTTMTESVFHQVKDPLVMIYYYKDEKHQDNLVSVKKMEEMFPMLGTPDSQKRKFAITEAGTHIIGSSIFNHDLDEVWQPITQFCEEVLRLPVVNDTNWRPFVDQHN